MVPFRSGRFAKKARETETQGSGNSFGTSALETEETLFQFLTGYMDKHFKSVGDKVLFIKMAHADGIESWSIVPFLPI